MSTLSGVRECRITKNSDEEFEFFLKVDEARKGQVRCGSFRFWQGFSLYMELAVQISYTSVHNITIFSGCNDLLK